MTEPKQVWVLDKDHEKASQFAEGQGCRIASSAEEMAAQAGIVILAVKPQDLSVTAKEWKDSLKPGTVLISVLAGTPVEKLCQAFGKGVSVVRAMPNLGAEFGEAMTALTSPDPKALTIGEAVFEGCGKTLCLDEKQSL